MIHFSNYQMQNGLFDADEWTNVDAPILGWCRNNQIYVSRLNKIGELVGNKLKGKWGYLRERGDNGLK
jgi:hypothetical protein